VFRQYELSQFHAFLKTLVPNLKEPLGDKYGDAAKGPGFPSTVIIYTNTIPRKSSLPLLLFLYDDVITWPNTERIYIGAETPLLPPLTTVQSVMRVISACPAEGRSGTFPVTALTGAGGGGR
jgi:hypothetical protein